MSANPVFIGTYLVGHGQITAANVNRDGTGTIVDIATGAALGTLVETLDIIATVATTIGMIRLYLLTGGNTRLWKEIPVVAVNPSATTPTWSFKLEEPLFLPVGVKLRASTERAETFNVFARGGDA